MEISPSDIGVVLVTYKRPEYYRQVLESLPNDKFDTLVVVNDGVESYAREEDAEFVILNNKQLGVSKSKNLGIKKLLDHDDEIKYIFVIEDDILVKDPNVFSRYINVANASGIHHLCYEKVNRNGDNAKFVYEIEGLEPIAFYHNPQGAFMYINANIIKKLGYFDENYINAFEHIDFEYNLDQKIVAPPFWYFPDLLFSENYLQEIEDSTNQSTITNKENYNENWKKSAHYFTTKWRKFTNQIPDYGLNYLQQRLQYLKQNYKR
jgi:GT2 family glycosyltransferase